MKYKEYIESWVTIQNKQLKSVLFNKAKEVKGIYEFNDKLWYDKENNTLRLDVILMYIEPEDRISIYRKYFHLQDLDELNEFYGQVADDITRWTMYGKDNIDMKDQEGNVIRSRSFNTLAKKGINNG